MSKIRAKFKCNSSSKSYSMTVAEDGKTPVKIGTPGSKDILQTTFKFNAVYSSDPNSENHSFWHATPSGSLELNVTKLADDAFLVGRDYYLDFTLAD
jgi:hypothetical protein